MFNFLKRKKAQKESTPLNAIRDLALSKVQILSKANKGQLFLLPSIICYDCIMILDTLKIIKANSLADG